MGDKFRMSSTLCFDCQNAVCGCSWALCFIPVDGWKALKTTVEQGKIETYRVLRCPKFKPDRMPTSFCGETFAERKREFRSNKIPYCELMKKTMLYLNIYPSQIAYRVCYDKNDARKLLSRINKSTITINDYYKIARLLNRLTDEKNNCG